ncbi:MAG: glycosyltransferase family 4 protein [Clostridia bacterium]|nr:glycosyltransferase family 4 protein [Clostridia bacterium]
MIGHKVVPSRRGGIENVLTTLCPMMVEMGLDVTCYNRSSDKVENEYVGTVKNKMYKGVKLKNAWTLNIRGFAAMIASFTAAIAASFGKYDVIHFHAEGPCAALWIPKLFGKKCVATVHGLDWQREKWGKGFASKYIKFGEKILAKYADEVIVLSKAAYDYFKETYNRETVIINNGIERPERKDAELITQKYGLKKDEYIAVVSRLTAEKGIHYLIDAYSKITTDKKLVIAGDTSDTDDYVKMLKEKAEGNPNIIFTGFISGDILNEIYSNAYIMTLPSDLEGMSLCLLEALAYKNALLCSDIPENTAVAEDKAIYFKKGNVEDLAEKLKELCDDSALVERFRDGADEFILNKYNWQDVAEATCNLYSSKCSNAVFYGVDYKN